MADWNLCPAFISWQATECRSEACKNHTAADLKKCYIYFYHPAKRRTQRPRGLRPGSAAVHLLLLRVRIPPKKWISASFGCCVLSCRGLCDEFITRPEETYRMWCVRVWMWILDNEQAQGHCDCRAMKKKTLKTLIKFKISSFNIGRSFGIVNELQDWWSRNMVSNSGRDKTFFCSLKCPARSWGRKAFNPGCSFLRGEVFVLWKLATNNSI